MPKRKASEIETLSLRSDLSLSDVSNIQDETQAEVEDESEEARMKRKREDERKLHHVQPAHVFMVHAKNQLQPLHKSQLLKLPHGRFGSAFYLLNEAGQILDIQIMRPSYQLGAWFIDNSTARDGALYICSPIDPLFIFLPVLQKAAQNKAASGKPFFRNFEELLTESEACCPLMKGISAIQIQESLPLVCECSTLPGSKAQKLYRLDDAKLLLWLQTKLLSLYDALAKIPASRWRSEATSSALIAVEKSSPENASPSMNAEECKTRLRVAFDLISDHLSDELSEKLRASVDRLIPKKKKNQANSFAALAASNPMLMAEFSRRSSSYEEESAKKPEVNMSYQAKRLAKANTKGIGKMTSFFRAKKKS